MRSNSAIAEGTVLIRVTSSFSGRLGRCSAFRATMTLPPALNVTNISNTDRSKQTDVENRTAASSCGVKTCFAH